jgi:hypothetical protein
MNLYLKFHCKLPHAQNVVAFVAAETWDSIKNEVNKNICQEYMNTPVSAGDSQQKQKMVAYKSWFGEIVRGKCYKIYEAGRRRRQKLFETSIKTAEILKTARLSQRRKQVIITTENSLFSIDNALTYLMLTHTDAI